MNNTTLGAAVGKSSPSKLAPETIKIRNALIEKYSEQPIEELNEFLQRALEVEKDELKRLGLLAARVYILRQKVLSLKAFIRDERLNSIPTPNLALTEQILLDETANSDIDANNQAVPSGEWHSLQMIEPGEVNGVRFFQGTVINAKTEDAEKLISSGKAIFIDEKGKPVELNTAEGMDSEVDSNELGAKDEDTADVVVDDNTGSDTASDGQNADVTNSADIADNIDSEAKVDTLKSDTETTEDSIVNDAANDEIAHDNKNTDDSNSDDVADNLDSEATVDTIESEIETTKDSVGNDAANGDIAHDNKNADDTNSDGIPEKTVKESLKDEDVNDLGETKA